MRKAVFIQARMSSQRFPRKMLGDLTDHVPLVEYVYKRCLRSQRAEVVAVLTSEDKSDDDLVAHCSARKIMVYRGSLDNVLGRYIRAGEYFKADAICRVCGDTPFVDVALMDTCLDTLVSRSLDYAAPGRHTCAAGFYSETVALQALKKAAGLTKVPGDLEHVTKFILDHQGSFHMKILDAGLNPEFIANTRFTVDHPEDMGLCRRIAAALPAGYAFTAHDVLEAVRKIKGDGTCAG